MIVEFVGDVLVLTTTIDRVVSLTRYSAQRTAVSIHDISNANVRQLRLAFGAEDERRREAAMQVIESKKEEQNS